MKKRPTVALLIETSNAYTRGLLQGIVSYVREHRSWSISLPEHRRGEKPPPWLSSWNGDGIIARIENPPIAKAVVACGVPVVDVSAARQTPSVPWVETDDEEIARLAIDHFLERGFRNLAYCGVSGFNWSKWRCEHFQRFAGERGLPCSVFQSAGRNRRDSDWEHEQKRLVTWVRRLPKPVGVMACYDIRAQQLLDACRAANIAVPEEVAVLGVDNDELLCNLSDPPLSSVIPNTHRTGYEAATLLDRMMAKKKVITDTVLIKPLGIRTRQSTDILAIEDKQIAEAVRFIRRHACDGIDVSDVLKNVLLSRRELECRFRKALGRTPHAEIVNIRLGRVKQLLSETELKLRVIAERAGYRHVEYMNAAFKKHFGVSPGRYRTQN